MGNKQAKSNSIKKPDASILLEEEIQLLLTNTHFNRTQILEWHAGFIVIIFFIENIMKKIFMNKISLKKERLS